ncbi:putative polyamine oxidase 4 [Beauveria bassiana]|nr:putative polyamine oxidase 4 [Beauveria bassiana]
MAVDEDGAGGLVHYDSIVLGAGMAGLAFASRLLQSSHISANKTNRLRILEARDRIGGRIASVHVQNCRLDTGANWIHGIGNANRPNPLIDILPHKRHRPMKGSVLFRAPNGDQNFVKTSGGIATECSGDDGAGQADYPARPGTATASTNGLLIPAHMAKTILSFPHRAAEELQALAVAIPAKAAKQMSVLRALVNTAAFQDAFELVPSEYSRTLGALFQGIESMEAAPLLAQTAEPGRPESEPGVGLLEYAVDDFDGEHAFLQDGYAAIIDEIAKPLVEAGVIDLETVVTRVHWTRNPIVIETSRGNFSAREVVCTLPLGVLKDGLENAMFAPSLPADKQEAIERLGFGTLDKIFAIYSWPWWNDEAFTSIIKNGVIQTGPQCDGVLPDSFLGFTSELSGISVGHNGCVTSDVYRLPIMNLHSLTGQPVLCAFVSCKVATTVEAMTNEDISGLFHRTLTQWFGTEPPKPDAVHVTRWAEDPYSRGAYSHVISGLSEPKHRDFLQQPIANELGGVLRFAGEHCSRDHFAMAHGALLDGWRAADGAMRR